MKRIGLTGNIGTGKSTVAKVFETLGAHVYHADTRARKLLESDAVAEQLKTIFGNKVITPKGEIDRKVLASIVFNDKAKLAILNNLVHPLVENDFEAWCLEYQSEAYILHEAAILFESGFDRLFDACILVTAPVDTCVQRVMKRDSVSAESVMARMQNQWPQEKKIELAQYIVVNDENTLVLPQVLELHRQLRGH